MSWAVQPGRQPRPHLSIRSCSITIWSLIASLATAVVLALGPAGIAWADDPEPSPTGSVVTEPPEPSPSSSGSEPSPAISESGEPSPESSPSPTAPDIDAETAGHVWTDDEATALLVAALLVILLVSVHVTASLGR